MKEYVEYILAHRHTEYFNYWTGEEVARDDVVGKVVESRCSMCTTHPPYMCICKISNISPAHLTTDSTGTGEATENYNGRFSLTYGRDPSKWVEYTIPQGTMWLNYWTGGRWSSEEPPFIGNVVEMWCSKTTNPKDLHRVDRVFSILLPRRIV